MMLLLLYGLLLLLYGLLLLLLLYGLLLYVAVVSAAAAVDGVWAAAAELATAVLTWRACGAVTACLGVDPGPGSAVAPLHVAV